MIARQRVANRTALRSGDDRGKPDSNASTLVICASASMGAAEDEIRSRGARHNAKSGLVGAVLPRWNWWSVLDPVRGGREQGQPRRAGGGQCRGDRRGYAATEGRSASITFLRQHFAEACSRNREGRSDRGSQTAGSREGRCRELALARRLESGSPSASAIGAVRYCGTIGHTTASGRGATGGRVEHFIAPRFAMQCGSS